MSALRSSRPASPAEGESVGQNAARDQRGVAADPDRDRFGEADAIRIDVDLDDLRLARPVVDAVAGQRGERIEARAEREHHVGAGDQFHRRLRSIVAQRPDREPVRAGEAVVVLVAVADRRIEPLGERDEVGNGVREHDACAREDDREFRRGKQRSGLGDRLFPARRAFELNQRRQLDVDDLRPEIPRHVDLRRRRQALGFLDHAVENLGDARGVPHLLLIADGVAEHRHLIDLLEAAEADCLVRRLGRHDQHRGVVPVGRLDRGDEVGDAGAVLRDRHGDPAGRAGIAVADQPAVRLVRDVPEGDPRLGEEIRDRHERRPNDPERLIDPVPLENFHERFFCRDSHFWDRLLRSVRQVS